MTQKIVINHTYGGFGVSDEVRRRLPDLPDEFDTEQVADSDQLPTYLVEDPDEGFVKENTMPLVDWLRLWVNLGTEGLYNPEALDTTNGPRLVDVGLPEPRCDYDCDVCAA